MVGVLLHFFDGAGKALDEYRDAVANNFISVLQMNMDVFLCKGGFVGTRFPVVK